MRLERNKERRSKRETGSMLNNSELRMSVENWIKDVHSLMSKLNRENEE